MMHQTMATNRNRKVSRLLLLVLLLLATLGYWLATGAAPLDSELLRRAEAEFTRQKPHLTKQRYITLIDYRRHILQKRMWVFDRKERRVVLNARVSHAFKSGVLYPTQFSNIDGTNKSCTGSFITLKPYTGKFGYSMRIKGVTKGVNDNAHSRAIVFHPDPWYKYSKGCFMTDGQINARLIHLIEGGSLVYVTR